MKTSAVVVCLSAVLFMATLVACGAGGSNIAAPVPIGEKPTANSNSPSPQVPAEVVFDQLTILVVGQSISSNCNEHKFGPVENVFQIGRDGSVRVAQDPFEWADCSNGSMWMPLGKLLIDGRIAKKVVFMPIGVGGTKVSDWQERGLAYQKLNDAIALIKEKKLHFDFAFWHQGSSDIGTDANDYFNRLTIVVEYIDKNVDIGRWVIALHSRCSGLYDASIENAQRQFASVAGANRFIGPNNNILDNTYRIDGCHLTQGGQEMMAGMWYDSMKNALGYK